MFVLPCEVCGLEYDDEKLIYVENLGIMLCLECYYNYEDFLDFFIEDENYEFNGET